MYTIQYMQVSGREKSQFSKVKTPDNEWSRYDQSLRNYYFDWQTMRHEAVNRVSYVVNTERWVRWSIGIFIIVVVFGITSNAFSQQQPTKVESEPSPPVYTIEITQLKEPFSQDSLTLNELHVVVKKRCPKRIIAVTNGSLITMDFVKLEFAQYEQKVQVVFYSDTTLSTNELKLILDGGI